MTETTRPEEQAMSQEDDAERHRERANRLEELLSRHVAAERRWEKEAKRLEAQLLSERTQLTLIEGELNARDAALASANVEIANKQSETIALRVGHKLKDAEIERLRAAVDARRGFSSPGFDQGAPSEYDVAMGALTTPQHDAGAQPSTFARDCTWAAPSHPPSEAAPSKEVPLDEWKRLLGHDPGTAGHELRRREAWSNIERSFKAARVAGSGNHIAELVAIVLAASQAGVSAGREQMREEVLKVCVEYIDSFVYEGQQEEVINAIRRLAPNTETKS